MEKGGAVVEGDFGFRRRWRYASAAMSCGHLIISDQFVRDGRSIQRTHAQCHRVATSFTCPALSRLPSPARVCDAISLPFLISPFFFSLSTPPSLFPSITSALSSLPLLPPNPTIPTYPDVPNRVAARLAVDLKTRVHAYLAPQFPQFPQYMGGHSGLFPRGATGSPERPGGRQPYGQGSFDYLITCATEGVGIAAWWLGQGHGQGSTYGAERAQDCRNIEGTKPADILDMPLLPAQGRGRMRGD